MPSSLWGNKRSSNIGPARNIPKSAASERSTSSIYTSIPTTASSRPQSRTVPSSSSVRSGSRGSKGSRDSTRLDPTKDVIPRRRSPAIRQVSPDSEDDGEEVTFDLASKQKYRIASDVLTDLNRQLSSIATFSDDDYGILIHAVDIASLEKGFMPALNPSTGDVHAQLQYPGSSRCERYQLVVRKDDFNPVKEIIDVVQAFIDFFPTSKEIDIFSNPTSGIKRKLERAASESICDLNGFKSAILAYNVEVENLRKSGSFSNSLKQKHNLPFSLVERIMVQAYDRAVSPNVSRLVKYKNGSDEVYGELRNGFVFNILAETRLTSAQVFVDLGSGVSNVVLQAALQIGCESWGCEIMPSACDIAEKYRTEFTTRCRLWGINVGPVHLERGDMRTNNNIRGAIKRADVILVNNRVFQPGLNNDLINIFLDCKDGCKIVHMAPFVASHYKITDHTLNNPANLLDVEQKSYPARSVSWTSKGDVYYVSTKDSKRLQQYNQLSS